MSLHWWEWKLLTLKKNSKGINFWRIFHLGHFWEKLKIPKKRLRCRDLLPLANLIYSLHSSLGVWSFQHFSLFFLLFSGNLLNYFEAKFFNLSKTKSHRKFVQNACISIFNINNFLESEIPNSKWKRFHYSQS